MMQMIIVIIEVIVFLIAMRYLWKRFYCSILRDRYREMICEAITAQFQMEGWGDKELPNVREWGNSERWREVHRKCPQCPAGGDITARIIPQPEEKKLLVEVSCSRHSNTLEAFMEWG